MNSFISQFGRPTGAVGRLLGRVMTLSNKKMHRAVMAELNGNERLLEIGFGSGAQLAMIAETYPDAILSGIDISEDMLDAAAKRLDGRAELSLCDCEKTAFKDAGFDAVITTDTCYFWKDPQKVFAEIKRITVPSGKLVIAYNAMYAASVHKSMGTAMYSDESILAELEKAGIRVTSKCSCGLRQTVFTAIL